jgi:methionyl-tRNA formyltransferase
MNVLIAGQKYFGAEVFKAVQAIGGVHVVAVSAPVEKGLDDRLYTLADQEGVQIIKAGTLNANAMPKNIDLIIAAHSHDFIGEKTRLLAQYGGIGYHPSLLPLHRGRDAIKWAIRMRERVTGGTVYRLSNRMDGGNVLAQHHVFIRPDDTADSLWRRDLAPLGIALITHVVRQYLTQGYFPGVPQDESLATWEPSTDCPPVYRPDLILLPHAPC